MKTILLGKRLTCQQPHVVKGMLLVAVRRAHILWVVIHQSLNHPAVSAYLLIGMHAIAVAQVTFRCLVHTRYGCGEEAAHTEPDRQSHASGA